MSKKCEVIENGEQCKELASVSYYNKHKCHDICTKHWNRSDNKVDDFTLTSALFIEKENKDGK